MKEYIILNTENNRSKDLKYGRTTEKPAPSIDYRTVTDHNGTEYDTETPERVINILERYRQNPHLGRLALDYGDTKTGQSWGQVYDTTGYIGRSNGTRKIPILIHDSRSHGGGAILDHCIVRIQTAKGKSILYQHSTYKPAKNEK